MTVAGLLAASLALTQGVFGVSHRGAAWWFTTPNDKPFWSFGVDCVDQGETEKEWRADNPGFASFRLYDSPKQWAETTTDNLRSWGFNSLGGWSDYTDLERLDPKGNLPFFVVLHLGAYANIPFHDMYAPEARKAMWNAARDQIPKIRDNPNFVGYFTDNELGWWGDTLFITYLAMANSAPGKQRIMACIRRFYGDDFSKLRNDWITSATSFEALAAEGKMKLRPGSHGIDLVNAWLTEMGTYYYSFVRDAVRAYDRKHLILGDRYCQFYEIPIAKASAKYTDVTSTNFGATWNDGTIAHFFLDGLHKLTGHPIVITEFYMGATENRSGNKNTPAAFPIVQTQEERAEAFRTNIEELASLPYVIGAHWFQYYDEPPKGRGDGENFNHGLLDTQGRPYELMVAAAQAAKPAAVHAHPRLGVRRLDGVKGSPDRAPGPRIGPKLPPSQPGDTLVALRGAPLPIPKAPPDPLKDLKLWPRDRGFIPPDNGLDFGDLYVCRDAHALYLGMIAVDYADRHLYEGDQIPESERMEWTIRLGGKTIHIRLGDDGQRAVCDAPDLQLSEVHGLQHQCLIRVPFEFPGSKIKLSSSVATHSRGYAMSWHRDLVSPPVVAAAHSSGLEARDENSTNSRPMRFASSLAPDRKSQRSQNPKSKIQNLESTRFRVIEDRGIDWLVRPEGTKLLSRGVCVVDPGFTPKTFDPKNPGFAAYRYYLTTPEWAEDSLKRIQEWGFNTVGAWSDTPDLLKPNDPKVLFTPILHMGSAAGAPWRDMWDPKIVTLMDEIARKQIQPLAKEPRIVGYFSDNEMGWWYGAMWDWAFRAGVHSREHLVALLQSRYHNWRALNSDFDPDKAASFQDLKTKGRLYLRPGSKGIETVKAWMGIVSDRYYALCRRIIKKYDPGALYLGDRYISNFYPEVAASAGKYCDVVSTNLNADTGDGAFVPFYLPALRAIAKRPIMITEYYECSDENRSGNQNNSSGFPVAPTQAARAVAFKRQTEALLRTPYVVGAHWFQYYDEPMHGRGDGENYDMGLVDIDNRPYERLTQTSAEIDANRIHRQGPAAEKHGNHIPTLSSASIRTVDVWIDRGLLVPSASFNARGNLYLAQCEGRRYACVYWNEDLFPEAFYRSGKVPTADDAKLEIQMNGQRTELIVPAKGDPIVKNGKAIAYKWGVRNYAILELPAAGDTVRLSAAMTTRARAYRMAWRTPDYRSGS